MDNLIQILTKNNEALIYLLGLTNEYRGLEQAVNELVERNRKGMEYIMRLCINALSHQELNRGQDAWKYKHICKQMVKVRDCIMENLK